MKVNDLISNFGLPTYVHEGLFAICGRIHIYKSLWANRNHSLCFHVITVITIVLLYYWFHLYVNAIENEIYILLKMCRSNNSHIIIILTSLATIHLWTRKHLRIVDFGGLLIVRGRFLPSFICKPNIFIPHMGDIDAKIGELYRAVRLHARSKLLHFLFN